MVNWQDPRTIPPKPANTSVWPHQVRADWHDWTPAFVRPIANQDGETVAYHISFPGPACVFYNVPVEHVEVMW